MSKMDKDSLEYKALNALHEDLQKDSGDWHIQGGDLEEGVKANTGLNLVGKSIASVDPTTIDFTQFKNLSQDQRMSTLATEGGNYVLGSGRAGDDLKATLGAAAYWDKHQQFGKDPDFRVDAVTNGLFNYQIHVPLDDD